MESIDREGDDCPICFEELTSDIFTHKGAHSFHLSCLRSYWKTSGRTNCPICIERIEAHLLPPSAPISKGSCSTCELPIKLFERVWVHPNPTHQSHLRCMRRLAVQGIAREEEAIFCPDCPEPIAIDDVFVFKKSPFRCFTDLIAEGYNLLRPSTPLCWFTYGCLLISTSYSFIHQSRIVRYLIDKPILTEIAESILVFNLPLKHHFKSGNPLDINAFMYDIHFHQITPLRTGEQAARRQIIMATNILQTLSVTLIATFSVELMAGRSLNPLGYIPPDNRPLYNALVPWGIYWIAIQTVGAITHFRRRWQAERE